MADLVSLKGTEGAEGADCLLLFGSNEPPWTNLMTERVNMEIESAFKSSERGEIGGNDTEDGQTERDPELGLLNGRRRE